MDFSKIAKTVYSVFFILTAIVLVFGLLLLIAQPQSDSVPTLMFKVFSIVYIIVLFISLITLIINTVSVFTQSYKIFGFLKLFSRLSIGLLAGFSVIVILSLLKYGSFFSFDLWYILIVAPVLSLLTLFKFKKEQ